MAQRVAIALFVKELEAALKRGDGYIMASYGQNPRTGYLDLNQTKVKGSWKPTGWYYEGQYKGKQLAQALKWREKCTRVWDCNGLAEGIYEIHTGVCINARARNNYASWCGVKGTGIIPVKYRVPGAAIFWGSSAGSIHHVAYLWKPVKEGHPEGDWYIIEARGVMYGVVKAKLLSRKPDYWGLMDKYFDYGATSTTEPVSEVVVFTQTLGSRVLKNGSEGEDVKEMQSGLIKLGYDLGKWGADGDFGDQTEIAVRAFQIDNNLESSGVFDAATYEAFEKAMTKLEAPVEDPKYVAIENGNCYVRTAPNTSGKAIGVAYRGEKLAFGGQIDEETRWLLVQFTKKGEVTPVNGWVSPKYGRLIE